MPGISLLRTAAPGVADGLFESVRFFDDYEVTLSDTSGGTVIGHSGYPGYPVRRVETDDAVLLLEGHLYDADDVDGRLERFGELLATGDVETVADALHDHDGDYLLVAYRKAADDVFVFNDPLCRLPTYYATVDGDVVLSRELKFVREFGRRRDDPVHLDRLGAAQVMTFGYALGDRTLFEGVSTLGPGAVAHVDDGIDVERRYRHRFDGTTKGDRSVAANGAELASRFVTACENRDVDGAANVISLSGGLDSRAVAGAYARADLPATAATFEYEGRYTDEVRVARRVADALGMEWSAYDLTVSEANRSRLLECKQGMNYLGMAFILDFFEQLRADHGRPTYVTGDGGDKVLVDLTPSREFDSLDDLVEFAIESNERIPLADAAAAADVDPDAVRRSVAERLRSYPETDRTRQYVHFLFRERGLNYLNQGEDRNRYYFWSVAPFYSLPVFEYAMNCPDEQKRGRDLYAAFLRQFAPSVLDIEYPNFGAPITSLEYRTKRRVYDLLGRYPRLQSVAVDLVTSSDDSVDDSLSALAADLSADDVYPLSEQGVAAILDRYERYGLIELNLLATLTAIVEGMTDEERARVDEPAVAAEVPAERR